MKKLLLAFGCVAALLGMGTGIAQAVELPEPTVNIPIYDFPPYGYFYGIDIVYWKIDKVEPYVLSINPDYRSYNGETEILNDQGLEQVKVLEDMNTPLEVYSVSLVEWKPEDSAVDDETEPIDNAQLSISLDFQMPTKATFYSVVIPAGLFYINVDGTNVLNEEIQYSFSLTEATSFEVPAPVLNPAEGVISSLESVRIEWPNPETGVLSLLKIFQENRITATFNGVTIESLAVDFEWDNPDNGNESQNGNIMIIDLGKEYTTPGQYVINIPSAIMWISDLDGSGSMDNPAYSFVYTVAAEPQAMAAPTINPEDKATVESLSTFTLTFAEGMVLSKNELQSDEEDVTAPEVTLTLDGEAIEGLTLSTTVSANVLTVTLNEAQTEPGTYMLNVPQGYVIYEDADGYTYYNEVVNATYTILPSVKAPGVMPQPTKVTPENNALVEVLSTVTVSWDLPLQINANNKTPIVLSQLSGDKTYNPEVSVKGNDLVLNFINVAEGAYSLVIPAEYVIATEGDAAYYNPEVTLYYGVQEGELKGNNNTFEGETIEASLGDGTPVEVEWTGTWNLDATVTFSLVIESSESIENIGASLYIDGTYVGDFEESKTKSITQWTYTTAETFQQNEDVEFAVVVKGNSSQTKQLPLAYSVGSNNDTAGVKDIRFVPKDGNVEIYNLQGVKVDANKLGRGIYIINGKKVRL